MIYHSLYHTMWLFWGLQIILNQWKEINILVMLFGKTNSICSESYKCLDDCGTEKVLLKDTTSQATSTV